MSILKRFSEQEKNYHLYRSQQNAIREERTRQSLLDRALKSEQAAIKGEKIALQEQARLRTLLERAGIDPDNA